MIIDLILDRKDGKEYKAKAFYNYVLGFGDVYNAGEICNAMDNAETEFDVKRAINIYIVSNDYNPDICNYVNSVNWLE